MLKFDEYVEAIENLEENGELLRKKIAYRILEILGPRPKLDLYSRSHSTINREDEEKVDSDIFIIELRRQLQANDDRRDYIIRTGELPEDVMIDVREHFKGGVSK